MGGLRHEAKRLLAVGVLGWKTNGMSPRTAPGCVHRPAEPTQGRETGDGVPDQGFPAKPEPLEESSSLGGRSRGRQRSHRSGDQVLLPGPGWWGYSHPLSPRWHAGDLLPPVSSRGCPSVCVCVLISSCKDISHTGSGPTLYEPVLTKSLPQKPLSPNSITF